MNSGATPSPDRVPPLPASALGAVRAAYLRGREVYGDLGRSEAAFLATVARQGAWHLRRRGLAATAEALGGYVAKAALPDLYLTGACEESDAGAWEALHAHMAARLEGFAVRRGRSSAEAESLVQDLLGDLASPPPSGGARTLLGTFDATGSLFGWLCVVLLRRIAAGARRRPVVSLDAATAAGQEPATEPRAGRAQRPALEQLVEGEEAARLARAIERAWEGLTPQQRFALVLKHRDARTQREVGLLLGVGEARVSRVVAGAVALLTQGVRDALGADPAPAPGGETWARLEAALARHLASRGPQAPPTQGRDEGRGSRAPRSSSSGSEGTA